MNNKTLLIVLACFFIATLVAAVPSKRDHLQDDAADFYVPPPKQAACGKRVQPKNRLECGHAGITKAQCESNSSCCFDDSIRGTKWCFYKHTAKKQCSRVDPKGRKECGWAGITREQCLKKTDCCFDNSIKGAKWCFKTYGA